METIKAIKERRSIRTFKTEEVSKDLIMDMLDCTRLHHLQKSTTMVFCNC